MANIIPVTLLWLGALVLAGAAGTVILAWPPAGLVALVVGSMLVSTVVETGARTGLNFPVLFLPFLLLLWLVRLPWQGSLRRFLSAPFPMLAAFLVIAALSSLLGNDPRWAFAFALTGEEWFERAQTAPLRAQMGQLGLFAFSATTFLLVADQVRSLRWLQGLTWVFLILGGLCIASWVVPEVRRATAGLFVDGAVNGSLFWTWLVALAFTQAGFNKSLPPGLRLALSAVFLTALYLGLVPGRDWASGWIPPLVALLAALWIGAPRLALPLTIAGAVVLLAKTQSIVSLVLSADNQYSLKTRLEAWHILGEIVQANPVLGLGPANYYHNTALFPILGYKVQFSSHNNYIDILAQTGFLGIACLAGFLWQVGRIGWRLRNQAAAGFAHAYVIGALAGLAGTLAAALLGDWFLPFVYNVGLEGFRASLLGWFFLGGLVALDRIIRQANVAAAASRSDGEVDRQKAARR